MAALGAALPLPQVGHRAGVIGDDLDLEMASVDHQLLDIQITVAEGADRLGATSVPGLGQFLG